MPFPTIDGISFEQDLETIASFVRVKLDPGADGAFQRIFHRIDVVSTQLYDDMQATKHMLLNSHHKDESIAVGLVDHDPSQAPEHSHSLAAQTFHTDNTGAHPVLRPDPPAGTSDDDPTSKGPATDDSNDTRIP